MFTVAYVKNAH